MDKRVEVKYHGAVQGVGFRFTAERFASAYGAKGYVRNAADGGVQLVMEGEERTLKELLKVLYEEMANNIDKYSINWFPPTGEFTRFEIRLY